MNEYIFEMKPTLLQLISSVHYLAWIMKTHTLIFTPFVSFMIQLVLSEQMKGHYFLDCFYSH